MAMLALPVMWHSCRQHLWQSQRVHRLWRMQCGPLCLIKRPQHRPNLRQQQRHKHPRWRGQKPSPRQHRSRCQLKECQLKDLQQARVRTSPKWPLRHHLLPSLWTSPRLLLRHHFLPSLRERWQKLFTPQREPHCYQCPALRLVRQALRLVRRLCLSSKWTNHPRWRGQKMLMRSPWWSVS